MGGFPSFDITGKKGKMLTDAIIQERWNDAISLMKRGIGKSYADQFQKTALIDFIYYEKHHKAPANFFSTLLEYQKHLINRKGFCGWTALHTAIMFAQGDYPMVYSLLLSGADPNIEDSQGDTPLALAAKYDENVEFLLVHFEPTKSYMDIMNKYLEEKKALGIISPRLPPPIELISTILSDPKMQTNLFTSQLHNKSTSRSQDEQDDHQQHSAVTGFTSTPDEFK
jgi:ankyrin repeat protein